MNSQSKINQAKNGDINAFHDLFSLFSKDLKAFVYRMVADRADAEDLTHDVFVKSFDRIKQFEGKSSLKTWVFTIASNACIDFLRSRQRWRSDSQDRSRHYAESTLEVEEALIRANRYSPNGAYEIREHIDFCFTCTAKTLPIEEQIALLLKDVYSFTVNEISQIISRTPGVVKHLLHNGRKTMVTIFDNRCALVSKKGICHQCSELNGYFNPKQKTQSALLDLALTRDPGSHTHKELYKLRAELVKNINPLEATGSTLHEVFMQITRKVEGEIDEIDY